MLEPLKILMKLWSMVEKSKMSRKRKDNLQTAIVLAIVVSVPLIIILMNDALEALKKALGL
jgi:hypothetical protein